MTQKKEKQNSNKWIKGIGIIFLCLILALTLMVGIFCYYRQNATLLPAAELAVAEEAVVTEEPDTEPEEASYEEQPVADELVEEEPVIEEEIPQPKQTASLIMVGDILLHTPVEECSRNEEGHYDYAPIFAHVKNLVEGADLALVNQEVIIGGEELGISGYPAFNAPYEIADELVDTGFDIICQATNHALDKGAKGVQRCLQNWQEKYPDIGVLGIHDSIEDQNDIYTTEVDGIKIAFLNYTYGTNGIPMPSDMPYAVDLLEEGKVRRDLQLAEEIADFTVVCPHWGTEYELGKTSYQDKWNRIFWEEGADLVIGTHPHVIEPIEMIEEDDRQMLVYYSLGNFVNWTSGTGAGVANRMVGGMARVTLEKDEDGTVFIAEYDVLPLVTHVTKGFGGVCTYPLDEYTDELAAENEICAQDSNFSLEYAHNLIEKVWKEEE